jgi:putative flavoprotein involved in K+ transport
MKGGESEMNTQDVIVIGAGQAGLAIGYYMKKKKVSFQIIDHNVRVGDSWRKRYRSLTLFTPRSYSSLPGLAMVGNQDEWPSKVEMADYLEGYAKEFELPITLNVGVNKLCKKDGLFFIDTSQGMMQAKSVVVATGSFQKPVIPLSFEDNSIFQVHSSQYDSPVNLHEGSVLIVGGGNSGAQIASELSSSNRSVTLAIGHPLKFLPLRIWGRSMFDWLEKTGLLYADKNSARGSWLKKQTDPIFGKELKDLIKNRKVVIKPRVMSVEGKEVIFEDGSKEEFQNIVWATGFKPSYDWIDINGVVMEDGNLNHQKGISIVENLYFIGLPWQSSRASGLVCGVGRDAAYISEYMVTDSVTKLNLSI